MTFLQLVTRLCEECGVPTDDLDTVTGQTGELKRMVNAVADAWVDIQSLHRGRWKFQRRSTSWAGIAGQTTYATTSCGITSGTFGSWIAYTFRSYVTLLGLTSEQFLTWVEYDVFRDRYLFGPQRSVTSTPIEYTIAPADSSIILGPAPIAGYSFSGDYYRAPIRLSVDADVPALPDLHDPLIIVDRAKMAYAAYESASEVYVTGEREYLRKLRRLEADQLDMPVMPGALA